MIRNTRSAVGKRKESKEEKQKRKAISYLLHAAATSYRYYEQVTRSQMNQWQTLRKEKSTELVGGRTNFHFYRHGLNHRTFHITDLPRLYENANSFRLS